MPFTLHLPDKVRDDLKFLSVSTNRTQSSIASEVLAEHIADRAYRVRAIQQAKTQAQKRRFYFSGSHRKLGGVYWQ